MSISILTWNCTNQISVIHVIISCTLTAPVLWSPSYSFLFMNFSYSRVKFFRIVMISKYFELFDSIWCNLCWKLRAVCFWQLTVRRLYSSLYLTAMVGSLSLPASEFGHWISYKVTLRQTSVNESIYSCHCHTWTYSQATNRVDLFTQFFSKRVAFVWEEICFFY